MGATQSNLQECLLKRGEFDRLRVGDKFDHRDKFGQFLPAIVRQKSGNKLRVHYMYYADKWDTECDYGQHPHSFAKYHSISRRPASNPSISHVTVGSSVSFRPEMHDNCSWRKGTIITMDKTGRTVTSGQVRVQYKNGNQTKKMWTHLDNEYEIRTLKNENNAQQQQQSSHNNHWGQTQTQSQVYANKQAQKQEQVKTRVLMEQLDGVIDTLDGILDMVQNRTLYSDTKINLMTDMLIKSCNYFARNCHSYKQQNYQKALKLAQKKIYDHWDSLDAVTCNDTISYRDFLMKAIQSKKLEQMNKRRRKTKHEQVIKNRASKDPKEINAAWSKIIYHKAKYDQQIEDYEANPAEKEQDYERQLAEFNKNKKYHKNTRSRQQIDESSMYFTKSGKSANFTLKKSLNEETDQKLDEELMGCFGGDSNENNNKKRYSFMNAVIYASPNNKLMDTIDCEMPCLLLEEPPKCGDARKVHIHLPNPYFNHKGYYIPVDDFVISRIEQIVEKVENDYMAKLKKLKMNEYLGYKSIVNQRDDVYNAVFGVDEDGDVNVCQ